MHQDSVYKSSLNFESKQTDMTCAKSRVELQCHQIYLTDEMSWKMFVNQLFTFTELGLMSTENED